MIPAPSHTQVPNIFFDKIISTLNEGELRIILIIMRQTFGWHKESDWMTYTFLAKKTGYNRDSVIKILNRLIQKKLVYKRVVGNAGSQRCYYSLVTDKIPEKENIEEDSIDTEEDIRLMKLALEESFKEVSTSVPSNAPEIKEKNTSVRRNTGPVFDGTPNKRNSYKRNSYKIVCYRGRCRGVGKER